MSASLSPTVSHRAAWTPALALLALGLVLLGLIFRVEVAAAIRTWENSTAYNHCWLVLPVAGWLAWVRRDRLAALTPEPTPALALLALPAALVWIVAERLGIMEGRQFAGLGLLWALALGLLGWRVCRAMAASLVYLVFLVPFGEFAVPALQSVTAEMIEIGLRVLGIPHYIDSLVIETPSGTFLVAEACAGLRFLVASLAFGALYAVTLFRSPGRRLAVMGLAVVVPIIANGVRALGIVVLAQYLGSAQAAAADHIIYGWGFFSVVIILLVLTGLPFREDLDPPPIAFQSTAPVRASGVRFAVATVLLGVLTMMGPLLAAALDRAGKGEAVAVTVPLAPVAGCAGAAGDTLRCGDLTVTAKLLVFPARTGWAAVAAERRRLLPGGDESIAFRLSTPGGDWDLRQPRDGGGAAAVAAWRDGCSAGDGLRSRAAQAWNSLRGGTSSPVIAAISIRPDVPRPGDLAQHAAVLRALVETRSSLLVDHAARLSSRPNVYGTDLSENMTFLIEPAGESSVSLCKR